MLQRLEFITCDFSRPDEGHAQLTAALRGLVKEQAAKRAAKEQRHLAFVVFTSLRA
jgi:hypothetical protein